MKRILTLAIMVLFAGITYGQTFSSPGVQKIAEQDYRFLEIKISGEYPNLKFNDAQKVKLMNVLTERAEEIHKLRSREDVSKEAYGPAYNAIAKKYESKLESIFSPEQKTMYLRKVKKVKE